MPIHIPSDTIHFDSISTGGNNAGNGGPGVNSGYINTNAHIDFNPVNYATGSDVSANAGDHVSSYHGPADSNHVGADTAAASASTTAYQADFVAAEMSQNVFAGVGGNGGNGDSASSGDVHVHT